MKPFTLILAVALVSALFAGNFVSKRYASPVAERWLAPALETWFEHIRCPSAPAPVVCAAPRPPKRPAAIPIPIPVFAH